MSLQATAPSPQRQRPEWAGDTLLSRAVNAAIGNRWLWDTLMKPMARQTLIKTAEDNGVAWRAQVAAWEAPAQAAAVAALKDQLTDPSVPYPGYYLLPFHAYADGNMNWLAAFEAEAATYSMALRVWPSEVKAGSLVAEAAQRRLRGGYTGAVAAYLGEHGLSAPRTVLDVGCSIGISTRALAAAFPDAESVTGMDLSPFMLAVAAARDAAGQGLDAQGAERRRWVHGLAEATRLADCSVDLYSAAFVHHELPTAASRAVMAEAFRVLRPGGVYVMCDNDPKSEVIQNLPPALFTLMKSTEPHSDEYYALDVEGELAAAGFAHPRSTRTDPRHRTVVAHKPL